MVFNTADDIEDNVDEDAYLPEPNFLGIDLPTFKEVHLDPANEVSSDANADDSISDNVSYPLDKHRVDGVYLIEEDTIFYVDPTSNIDNKRKQEAT